MIKIEKGAIFCTNGVIYTVTDIKNGIAFLDANFGDGFILKTQRSTENLLQITAN